MTRCACGIPIATVMVLLLIDGSATDRVLQCNESLGGFGQGWRRD
jgi:hypothetical protein